jgi:hypothetical protein
VEGNRTQAQVTGAFEKLKASGQLEPLEVNGINLHGKGEFEGMRLLLANSCGEGKC